MNKYLAKQILYGSGYLIFVFFIIFGFYFIYFKPAPTCFDNRQNQRETGVDCGGPCQDCEIKSLVPVKANWVKYFSADSKTILAAEIKNSNSNYGADNFSYTFDIYDKNGNKIKSHSQQSFIYADEIKCLVNPIDIDFAGVGDVKISFAEVNWILKEKFAKPKIQLREITAKQTDNQSNIEVSGAIINDNPFSLSKIKIAGFLINSTGIKLSASKTELENLEAFGEKSFKIIFPKGIFLSSQAKSSPFDFNVIDSNATQICVEAVK